MKNVVLLGLSAALLTATAMCAEPEVGAAKTEKKAKPAAPKVKGVAHVRILHAIVGAPAADVFLDGKKVAEGATFKSLSAYMDVESGKTAIKLTAAGKTDTILDGSATFMKDGYYTVAAYGTMDKALLTTQNDNTGKEDTAKARIRAFHLAPGAPDVEITTPSTRAKDGTSNVFKKLAYGKDMTKAVAPGKITLQVRADGKIIKEVPDVTLEAGKKYAIFAVGKVGGAGEQAFDVLVKPAGK